MNSNSNNIVFFSSCPDLWGGSEELWSQAAELLAQKNFRIHIYKSEVDFAHPQIKRLVALGCRITELGRQLPPLPRRILKRFLPHNSAHTHHFYIRRFLAAEINRLAPQLFIVSQGANFDGLWFIKECSPDKFRNVLLSQKATDSLWASDADRVWMKNFWQSAARSYFVSEHNLRITEEQFGMKIARAEIVRNPFLTKSTEPLPWTFPADELMMFACVARLQVTEKGQDILLRVLADKKWRERPAAVSFFGKGANEHGLKELANYFGLKNVFFRGHVSDIDSIWREHQSLVMPSRTEGLPLALIEALHCGRVAVVTDAGGNAEVLRDNVTGFVAKSAHEQDFDEALERAWQRRADWEAIGKLAATEIRQTTPSNPAADFAEKLLELI